MGKDEGTTVYRVEYYGMLSRDKGKPTESLQEA